MSFSRLHVICGINQVVRAHPSLLKSKDMLSMYHCKATQKGNTKNILSYIEFVNICLLLYKCFIQRCSSTCFTQTEQSHQPTPWPLYTVAFTVQSYFCQTMRSKTFFHTSEAPSAGQPLCAVERSHKRTSLINNFQPSIPKNHGKH